MIPVSSLFNLSPYSLLTPRKTWGVPEKGCCRFQAPCSYWVWGVMEKKMETAIVYWDNIRIMEKKMETAIVYWDNIRIMEKKMETTIGYLGLYGPVRHQHCRGRWSRGCDLLRVLCMDLRWHVPCMAICDLSRKIFCPPSRNYNKSSTWRFEKNGVTFGSPHKTIVAQ